MAVCSFSAYAANPSFASFPARQFDANVTLNTIVITNVGFITNGVGKSAESMLVLNASKQTGLVNGPALSNAVPSSIGELMYGYGDVNNPLGAFGFGIASQASSNHVAAPQCFPYGTGADGCWDSPQGTFNVRTMTQYQVPSAVPLGSRMHWYRTDNTLGADSQFVVAATNINGSGAGYSVGLPYIGPGGDLFVDSFAGSFLAQPWAGPRQNITNAIELISQSRLLAIASTTTFNGESANWSFMQCDPTNGITYFPRWLPGMYRFTDSGFGNAMIVNHSNGVVTVSNLVVTGTLTGTGGNYVQSTNGIAYSLTVQDALLANTMFQVTPFATYIGGTNNPQQIILTNNGKTIISGGVVFRDGNVAGPAGITPNYHWATTNVLGLAGWLMDTNEVLTYRSNATTYMVISTNKMGINTNDATGTSLSVSGTTKFTGLVIQTNEATAANVTMAAGTVTASGNLAAGGNITWGNGNNAFTMGNPGLGAGFAYYNASGGLRLQFGPTCLRITDSSLTSAGVTNLWVGEIIATNGVASYKGNAAAPVNITAGASPFTYTSTNRVKIEVYIGGGIVTALAKNGTTIASGLTLTGLSTVLLQTNETVTVTYSSTPTMNWYNF